MEITVINSIITFKSGSKVAVHGCLVSEFKLPLHPQNQEIRLT